MDEDTGRGSPRTLADVSHLFFSSTEGTADVSPDGVANGEPQRSEAPDEGTPHRNTTLLVVTGGDDSPGKSTVAVNLAHALMPFGRVALFDADPRIPNARYYLGLPSWHYLSPLTGDGSSAPNVVTDAGLLVSDWSIDGSHPADTIDGGEVIYSDVPESGRKPLDFAVIDIATRRTDVLKSLVPRSPVYVLTARPGRRGFESGFAALRLLQRKLGIDAAALVVNGAESDAEALAFHAKTEAAAERLLSVRLSYLGYVPTEPGMAAAQRERGAVVVSHPDGEAALSLRQIASNAFEMTRRDGTPGEEERVGRGEETR